MVRGCTIAFVLWLALAAGYWYWLDHAFDPPGSIIGGLVVGLIVAACIGSLINAKNALRDWSLASASQHGLPLADGRLVAISGTIHPVDKPLKAPFSGQECVICEYDLGRRSRGADPNTNTGADFAGFLMTPCVIRSQQGDIKLLGFPILEGYGDSLCDGFQAASNGYQFVKETEFENRTGLKMVTILSAFDDVWSDDDGLVQKNMRLGNVGVETLFPLDLLQNMAARDEARLLSQGPEIPGENQEHKQEHEGEFEQDEPDDEFDDDEFDEDALAASSGVPAPSSVLPKMTEKRVAAGDTVCAIGRYNELQRGLLPKGRGSTPNRLIRGSAEDVVKKARGSMVSQFFGGLIALVIANAAVYGAMQAYLHSSDTIQRRQQDAMQAIQMDDATKLKTLLHRGLDPNVKDSNGWTLLKRANQLGQDDLAKILREHGGVE
ncbi:MAG: ankyrin repeat domain-containing protein [Planctomycetales bacterium]|nr:ankyrin repeat domain-containing protein [Planctomycetales bacterium]